MLTQKISQEQIKELKVSSLPSRPTAPLAFGGRGYSAKEMKEAFDRLPLFIIERLNSLIDDICAEGDGSIASSIQTGIGINYTLQNMCDDIATGAIFSYITYKDESFSDFLEKLRADVDTLLEKAKEQEAESL